MENTFDPILRGLTLALFIVSYYDVSVTGLFGEVVEDTTTDRLFEDMGQADVVEFNIEDGMINFNVTIEDRQGQDEFWLIDFQPFVYMGKSAINFGTAYLTSNATGTCSNVEQSYAITDGYFGDDFFQSGNSTGSKELFATYKRGLYDDDGTRVDSMSFTGQMDNLMNCKHSDGSQAWQYYISTHDVTFTTVLYATNVRPLKTSVAQLPESIAYVQTNIKLVWTISRIAILNFVIASQSAYEPKMIEYVGRVIVEFDFAIVEPYILTDGTPDTSRVHLEMGISTYIPLSNSSLLVFMGEDFMYYIADTPGNVMTEILKMPPTIIEESPSCSFRRQGYCRQQWEFEFILEMNTTFLSEDNPLDATGVFYFQFDSYHCEDVVPSIDCVNHGLPLWNVSADVTIQTVIDVVDEDMDVVSVSVVKMSNNKGEDLRGGSPVSHMENVTVEVAISPSFLRERYQLELSLFMVCMGEDQSKSTRGCLGSDESERYTAFMADDFEMEYDPLVDPTHLIESSTSAHSLTLPIGIAVTEPTRYVEVDTTRQFLLVQEPATDSIHLLSPDQVTSVNDDRVLDNIFIQIIIPPSETAKSEFVIVEIKSSLSLILSKAAYSEFVGDYNDPQSLSVFQQIYDAMPPQSDKDYKVELFSSYLHFPGGEISYFGFSDPTLVPCNQFAELSDYQEYTDIQLSPFVPDISEDDFSYLRDVGAFYSLMINLTGSEGEDEDDNFEGGNFQTVEEWENVRDKADGVINGQSALQSLILDTVRIAHDDGPRRLQEVMYALILCQPNIASSLVSDRVVSVLEDLGEWTNSAEEDLWNFMSSVVRSSVLDHENQGRTTLTDHLKRAAQELKLLYPNKEDSDEIDAKFNPAYWEQHDIDESFYDLLINLTLQKNGHWNGVDYIPTSYISQSEYGNETDDNMIIDRVFGYTELSCSVLWDYTSSLWVYREPQVEYVETLAGGWDHWSMWSSCSASCEGGVRVRQRQCLDKQVPCTGTSDEVNTCNDLRCGLFKDENNLVHDVFLSGESRTFVQIQQYCASKQAVLVSYPHTPSQDVYILSQMAYQHIDHIWISPHSLGTCPILRYNGEVITEADCSKQHLSFCIKDFVKVFEGFAGTGQSIADTWYDMASDVDSKSIATHPQHFVDQELMRMWNNAIDVQMVQLVLYKNDQMVVDFKFDGTGTTRMNWFKAEHLETAWPYRDIIGKGFQPILQEHGSTKYKKVLTAEKKLGNCNSRSGWLMILDDEEDIMCDWQKHRPYPLFLFSQRNTASRWNSQFIGSATRVVISLKYYMQEPSPPPATSAPSIVYTTQNVKAPEEWQKLNYEEYDEENKVHRSDFTNFALSADTAVYTMTAVYGVVEKPSRRKRHQAHRSKRNLMKSLEYPQMKSIPFAFIGCPKDSLHNQSFLSCDCEAPGHEYSHDTFTCEPGHQLEIIPSSTVPTACGTKDTSPPTYALVLSMMGIAVIKYL